MTPQVLVAALVRIVNEAERDDSPESPLVVPLRAHGTDASITGRKLVAAPLSGQPLIMPDAWLANAHQAEEL